MLGRHDSFTSDEIIQGDVLSAMLSLMCSVKHKSQLAGLHVIAGLALTSEASARKLLTPNVLQVCSERDPGELAPHSTSARFLDGSSATPLYVLKRLPCVETWLAGNLLSAGTHRHCAHCQAVIDKDAFSRVRGWH